MASQIVLSLQSVVSRNADPVQQMVMSITSFETWSNAYNVNPRSVHLRGTIRTMIAEMRSLAKKCLRQVAELTALVFGAKAHVQYHPGYPVICNHAHQTALAADVALSVSGQCDEAPPVMGGR